MAPARTVLPQPDPTMQSKTSSSRAATNGTAGRPRIAATQAKAKMAQSARRDGNVDDDEEGAGEVASSSSADIKKMAEKIKAKQTRAVQAKRTAFERDAKSRLEAFRRTSDQTLDGAKKKSDDMFRYITELCQQPESELWTGTEDPYLDFSHEVKFIQGTTQSFQAESEYASALDQSTAILESRRSEVRRCGRERTAEAKRLCKNRLELIQIKAEAETFVRRYGELMAAKLSDRA